MTNPRPNFHKGTNFKHGHGIESGAILFRAHSIPTLLAICEYIYKDEELTPRTMIFVIEALKKISYR